jgi:menaquinone-dependent protoporphyrinogen oxidase
MKVLVIYTSRGGASKSCVELLEKKIGDSCEVVLCDAREAETLPTPDTCDVLVMGGSVRFGRIDKKLKEYIKANVDKINAKPSAFFFCCGFPSELEDYIDTQLPKKAEFSLGIHCFGGELKPQKLKGMDKIVVKMIRSHINSQDFEESDDYHMPLPELLPESVQRLADDIRKSLVKK